MRIAILGAGPAGLSAASYLTQSNTKVDVEIFDREHHLGGLQRSFEYCDRHFDVGTILFFGHHGMLDAFPYLSDEMVPIDYKPVSITPKGNYVRYPFTTTGFVKENGLVTTSLAALDLLYSKFRYAAKDSVEAYARYYMGGVVFRRSGLKNYIYRLHNVMDDELDVEFARKRLALVERQSIRRMLNAKITGGIKTISGPRLVRPEPGFPYMYEKIRNDLDKRGVSFRLGSDIVRVARKCEEFQLSFDGESSSYDRVISTIPIPSMLRLLGEEPKVRVQTKNLISLFYTGKFLRQGNTFFNFTEDASWKRITVFSRFYEPLSNGEDYFTVEITTDDDVSDERVSVVAREFEQHADKHGLLKSTPTLRGSHISLDAYPVYRRGEMAMIESEKERLKTAGIDLLGRQGNFEYVISNIVARNAKKLATRFPG